MNMIKCNKCKNSCYNLPVWKTYNDKQCCIICSRICATCGKRIFIEDIRGHDDDFCISCF